MNIKILINKYEYKYKSRYNLSNVRIGNEFEIDILYIMEIFGFIKDIQLLFKIWIDSESQIKLDIIYDHLSCIFGDNNFPHLESHDFFVLVLVDDGGAVFKRVGVILMYLLATRIETIVR